MKKEIIQILIKKSQPMKGASLSAHCKTGRLPISRKPCLYLVAGTGLEPVTFGL